MTIYDMIYNLTTNFPRIMEGVRIVVAFMGLVIFAISGKTLLTSQNSEKGARTTAWSGLLISPFLITLQNWMNIATNTMYATEMGPVFRVGEDFEKVNGAILIFNAVEVYVIAFGWFGLIASTFKLMEASKTNSPGTKRRAGWGIIIAVAMANPAITINVLGKTIGYDGAYNQLKKELTN